MSGKHWGRTVAGWWKINLWPNAKATQQQGRPLQRAREARGGDHFYFREFAGEALMFPSSGPMPISAAGDTPSTIYRFVVWRSQVQSWIIRMERIEFLATAHFAFYSCAHCLLFRTQPSYTIGSRCGPLNFYLIGEKANAPSLNPQFVQQHGAYKEFETMTDSRCTLPSSDGSKFRVGLEFVASSLALSNRRPQTLHPLLTPPPNNDASFVTSVQHPGRPHFFGNSLVLMWYQQHHPDLSLFPCFSLYFFFHSFSSAVATLYQFIFKWRLLIWMCLYIRKCIQILIKTFLLRFSLQIKQPYFTFCIWKRINQCKFLDVFFSFKPLQIIE